MKSRTPHNKAKTRIKYIGGGYGYISRRERFSPVYALIFTVLCGLVSLGYGNYVKAKEFYIEPFNPAMENNLVQSFFSQYGVEEGEQEEKSERQQIIEYIVEVFGEDSVKALGIAKAESGFNPNKEGIHRAGHYSWSSPTYKGECSIGLFQINLAEDGCEGKWVHASKVPGKTFQEKIDWLKVPENNIMFAKENIFDNSGWSPWSTYTNGSYKNI